MASSASDTASVSELSVGSGQHESFNHKVSTLGSDIALPYLPPLPGLVFLKVLVCELCRHRSDEPSPFTVKLAGFDSPCWPFAGSAVSPSGRRCKLCPWAHKFVQYRMDLKDLKKEMVASFTVTAEFLSCLRMLVELINDGTVHVGMRLRGPTTTSFELRFQAERAKVVSLIKQVSLDVDDKYRAITKEKWLQKNPGKDPVKCGHLVRTIPIEGRGLIECILVRHLEADE